MSRKSRALITGATSGIGQAFAERFAREGFDLALTGRNSRQLEETAQRLRADGRIDVWTFAADLATPGASEELSEACRREGKPVDVLVNNAGFGVYGEFAQNDGQRELDMLQVNIVALTRLTRLFLPDMIARRQGHVLNVGSTASFCPVPFEAVYGATKAYVLSFSEALAEELRDTGVFVTVLCPGPTATRFAERAEAEESKLFQSPLMSPEEVASIGFRAMQRKQGVAICGVRNKALIHSLRLLPRITATRMCRRIMEKVE